MKEEKTTGPEEWWYFLYRRSSRSLSVPLKTVVFLRLRKKDERQILFLRFFSESNRTGSRNSGTQLVGTGSEPKRPLLPL